MEKTDETSKTKTSVEDSFANLSSIIEKQTNLNSKKLDELNKVLNKIYKKIDQLVTTIKKLEPQPPSKQILKQPNARDLSQKFDVPISKF